MRNGQPTFTLSQFNLQGHARRYNSPTVSEVAALMGGEDKNKTDIMVLKSIDLSSHATLLSCSVPHTTTCENFKISTPLATLRTHEGDVALTTSATPSGVTSGVTRSIRQRPRKQMAAWNHHTKVIRNHTPDTHPLLLETTL
jgi:hypothetical protein